MLPSLLNKKGQNMRECRFFEKGSKDCWIDYPDTSYPCICKGNLDECPHMGLNGKPLKEGDYCEIKEE